jgi:uncharacterized protein YjbI with pentapeptide repeats
LDHAGNVISTFDFEDSNLKGTNVAGMISKLHVTRCDAEGSNFSGSSFWGESLFEKSHLKDANFTNTVEMKTRMFVIERMSAPKIIHTLTFNDCNLDGADFSNTTCGKLEFRKCTFNGTKFRDSDLTQTVFINCDLIGIDFGNAILTHTKFTRCENFYRGRPDLHPDVDERTRSFIRTHFSHLSERTMSIDQYEYRNHGPKFTIAYLEYLN